MASDFNKPVVGDAFATLLPAIATMFQDLGRQLEPTLTGTSTNIPTGTVRWNASTNLWERYSGSAWAALATLYAISISGNAATATTAAACSGNAATATSATSATTATNLAGGGAGTMPYQSASGTTLQLAAGSIGQVLMANGAAAPTWTAQSAIAAGTATTATNLAGGSAGTIAYQTAAGTTAQLAAGSAGQVLTSNGAAAPSWAAVQGVPSGAVFWFAAATAPTGYLECSGAAVSRTTYAALFAVIGTTWGAGDGTTTFNLPQLRGEFIRGYDNGRGVDAGRAFASAQADAMQGHVHTYGGTSAGGGFSPSQNGANTAVNISTGSPATDGTNGTPRTATETRSRNISMLPCIKT